MVEAIGYCALTMSVLSICMSNMRTFRWLHLISSCLYLAYGILITAWPIIIGALLFMGIHTVRLLKMYRA